MSDPAAPVYVADARTSIGELLAMIVAEDGRPRAVWLIELFVVAAASVLVLHSVDQGLSIAVGADPPSGALLGFGVAMLLNWSVHGGLSRRVLEALSAATSRTTERILAAVGRLDLERFEAVGGAEVISRITEDAAHVAPSGTIITQALVAVVTVALSMLYAATISVQAGFAASVAMLGMAILIARIRQSVRAQIARDQAALRRLQEPIGDLLAGFKQLRQHGARSAAVAVAFEREASALMRSREAHYVEFFAGDTISRQLYFGLLGAVGFVLPLLVPEAASEVSRLMVALTFIFRPVLVLLMAAPLITRLGATWQRMSEFAARIEAMAADEPDDGPVAAPFAELRLRAVTYQYAPQDGGRAGFAVGPCDLALRPGEIIFVTGANGSGKSTFVKLLCGLYRRSGGEMLVDGEASPVDPGPAWRGRFAAVFAELALFEELYGQEDVDPARVTALLEEMEIAHKVRFEGGRFTTVKLSTGQRKRLALVIALVEERPIYVFDEWAADQDPHFREAFYRRILPSLKARGKTVVAVTHDDDAFGACDRRIHFDGGRMEAV